MKRKIFKLILVTVVVLSLSVVAVAESTIVDGMEFQGQTVELTLEQAISIMLKDNITLKQAELDKEQAKVTIGENRSAISDLKNSPNAERPGSMSYNNILLLKKTNEFLEANAVRNYNATLAGLKASVEEAYYGVLNAQQAVEINKENLDIAKDLYEKTKKKYELGLVARQEVLSSEANVITAENTYKASVNALKSMKMLLNTKLGFDVMADVRLKDELTYEAPEEISIAQAVESAFANRYELKAAEFNYEKEKINMDIVAAKYTPNTFEYKKQAVNVEKAAKSFENARRNIEMEVRNNYMNMLQRYDEIKSGEKSVELAQEALKISQATYDAGMAVQTDVQKAQTALQQAKLGLANAKLNYKLAYLKFKDSISVGRISSQG